MSQPTLSRRRLLSILGTGSALPLLTLPGFVRAATPLKPSGNILVLIELAGGNDGLNTVVPITDPRYRDLRPEIGIDTADTLTLDIDTGLHPAMRGMADAWESGALQIVEGVGIRTQTGRTSGPKRSGTPGLVLMKLSATVGLRPPSTSVAPRR